ncbi:TldD/PmbA family protein, partial [Elusimicrobiota bacterium]
IDAFGKAGAEKSQCVLTDTQKHELNIEADKVTLSRTVFSQDLRLTVIKNKQRGILTVNNEGEGALESTVQNVLEIASASQQDSAYDISEKQPAQTFDNKIIKPDLDKMYDRMSAFLKEAKKLYPKTILEQAILDFTRTTKRFQNSNGAEFTSSKGIYNFVAMFTTKDGDKISSFNYSQASFVDIDKDLISRGSLNTLLKQSSEQVETRQVKDKFVGDIIVTPDCLPDFISFIADMSLGDAALIAGTSVYKDKLGQAIAAPAFTLHSKPVSKEIIDGYDITPDGYKAENLLIVDKGILKSFLLSLYGSKKTGIPKAINSGGCYVVEPGDKSFDDMIKSVKKGLLLARFSGGMPSNNGDFSGVAKNSYYIENGKIQYPINETMVSGNIADMFKNITSISKERIDFGSCLLPWVSFNGLTISGK